MTASKITPGQRRLLFFCLGVATFMMVIDYAIANISLPYIAGNLGVADNEGTYVVTSFAIGNAISVLMTGRLTKRIGQIRLIVASVALFTLASWLCGVSLNLGMLVVSRFLQGFAGGPIIPLCETLIIEYGTPETRRKDLATWAMIVVIGPILGPLIGGYITYWYSWPWIFYINIPVGIFCALTLWFMMRSKETKKEKVPYDVPGFSLLVIGVFCLQILLDKGQEWNWFNSHTIMALTGGSILAFGYLIIHELWKKSPLINLRLFLNPSFTFSIISLAISFAMYFGIIVLTPLWLQEYMGYTAVLAGLAVASQGLGPLLLIAVTPAIMKKLGNPYTLALSFVTFGAGCFFQTFFTTDVTMGSISLSRFVFGAGFVLYFAPLMSISIEGVSEEDLPQATGIFHFVRSLFGAIGTSCFKTLWERRMIHQHEILGTGLTLFHPIPQELQNRESLELLNNLVDQQSALISLNEIFYLMGWCYIGLIILTVGWSFFKKTSPSSATGSVHVFE